MSRRVYVNGNADIERNQQSLERKRLSLGRGIHQRKQVPLSLAREARAGAAPDTQLCFAERKHLRYQP